MVLINRPRRGRREVVLCGRGGNFIALENCDAIATFVANFCPADFSGPRYGKQSCDGLAHTDSVWMPQ